jgi:hypothetical protein
MKPIQLIGLLVLALVAVDGRTCFCFGFIWVFSFLVLLLVCSPALKQATMIPVPFAPSKLISLFLSLFFFFSCFFPSSFTSLIS